MLIVLVLLLVSVSLPAQRIDPNGFTRELSAGTGIGAQMTGNDNSPDVNIWLNYSRYYSRHVGFRSGVQYMPSNFGVDDFLGFPLAMSLRTGMFDYSNYGYGAMLALDVLDAFIWNYSDDIFADLFAIFLLSTINRGEIFFGITPGLVMGDSNIRQAYYLAPDGSVKTEYHGTKKAGSLYCSADAGINFSWRIWRFTLNLTPVFHWNFTDNYRIYSANEDSVHPQDTPARWFFNLNFGLGFLF